MTTFDTLWNNYPLESQEDLFNALGGGWPALIGDDNYRNTCTIRLSVTFNRSGFIVPATLAAQDGGLRDGAGNPIAIRVATGEAVVRNYFGDSYWGMSHQPGAPLDLSNVPTRKGILVYRVQGGDAGGHVDIWDGQTCRNDCHSQYALNCYGIALWAIP
jgi:Type VI secretion system (T6SS), amidase effector protein 4